MVIDPDVENLTALDDAVLRWMARRPRQQCLLRRWRGLETRQQFNCAYWSDLRVVGSPGPGDRRSKGSSVPWPTKRFARAFDGRNEVWADGLSFANAFGLEVDRCVTSFPEVSGTRPEYFTVKCCEPLSSAFVPPTGSFCLLELWTLESLNCRPSPIVDSCRDRLRDFPTPSSSRSISPR